MAGRLKTFYNASMLLLGRRIEKNRFKDEPIVIGACPRSGTTILLSILGAHPNIFAIPNQTYGFDVWEPAEDTAPGKPGHLPTRIDRVYREFVLNRIPPGATRWCEKTPKNIQYFDRILDYFQGKVRLIHIVRDGRDVVISKHPKHKPGEYWVDVDRWVNDVSCGMAVADNESVLTIRYEDLVIKYEATIRQICAFIDESVTSELDQWLQYTNIKKSKHLHKPVENLYAKSIGRWKNEEHRERIEAFMRHRDAKELLKRFKYITTND